jgi:hypothetical protein
MRRIAPLGRVDGGRRAAREDRARIPAALHQRRVVDDMITVIDAFASEHVERITHERRRPDLARMRRKMQTAVASARVHFRERSRIVLHVV